MAEQHLQPSSSKPSICPEKQQLSDSFVEAVRDVMALQDEHLAAHAAGSALDRFPVAIQLARMKRDRARELYDMHVRAHGC